MLSVSLNKTFPFFLVTSVIKHWLARKHSPVGPPSFIANLLLISPPTNVYYLPSGGSKGVPRGQRPLNFARIITKYFSLRSRIRGTKCVQAATYIWSPPPMDVLDPPLMAPWQYSFPMKTMSVCHWYMF